MRESRARAPSGHPHQPYAGTGAVRLPLAQWAASRTRVRAPCGPRDWMRRGAPPGGWPSPESQSGHHLRPGQSGRCLLGRSDKSPGRLRMHRCGPACPITHQTPASACPALRCELEIATSRTRSLPWRRSASWRKRDADQMFTRPLECWDGERPGETTGPEEVWTGRWRRLGRAEGEGCLSRASEDG